MSSETDAVLIPDAVEYTTDEDGVKKGGVHRGRRA